MIQLHAEWCTYLKEQHVARGGSSQTPAPLPAGHIRSTRQQWPGPPWQKEPAGHGLRFWVFAKCPKKYDANSDTPGLVAPSTSCLVFVAPWHQQVIYCLHFPAL